MSIATNLDTIKRSLPHGVKLVAVSKFHPESAILEAYNDGQRVFGESRMQELDRKQKQLPEDIEWHFIGHLQTNKVKYIVPYIHTIESVDSTKLLAEINRQAAETGRIINCMLEIHIAEEDTKYGLSHEECRQFLTAGEWKSLNNVRITGLMGMATYTEDTEQIRNEFRSLKQFYDELKDSCFNDKPYFSDISMGMSHDYGIAIEEGSTIIRVGSSIFGERT